VGEIFACARCLASTDQPDEVRIGGWTVTESSQDELARPLLMVQGDDLICRACWERQAPAWLQDAIQLTDLAYASPTIGEDDVVACPGCAESFAHSDVYLGPELLVFQPRLAHEGESCSICDSIDWVTIYTSEFGGWISLEGDKAPAPDVWEAHRDQLTPGFVQLLVDFALLEEE